MVVSPNHSKSFVSILRFNRNVLLLSSPSVELENSVISVRDPRMDNCSYSLHRQNDLRGTS